MPRPAKTVQEARPERSTYIAIALASAAVLLLEIAITRILSVVVWYHFAFLSISLAMLGLGAPGVWFALRPPPARALPIALIASGVTLPAAVIAIFKLGHPLSQAARLFPGLQSLLQGGLLLVIVSVLVPMLCLGSAVCLLLARARGPMIGRVYAADLAGATVGAAAVVPLMSAVPTPVIVAGAGILPLIAAAIVTRAARLPAAIVGLALIALIAWQEPFRLHYTKEYAEPRSVLYERWTPTARITVYPRPFFLKSPGQAFAWGMGRNFIPHRPVDQMWIEQDGSAGTPITRLDAPLGGDAWKQAVQGAGFEHLDYDVTSLAYQLTPPRRACVIGAGGGRDILCALRAGAAEVDAVELNPGIVNAVSKRFGDFSGHVYDLPGVRGVVSEGRSFLTRSPGDYDMVQISLIDSWAATAAGAFALSENYLYTTEALELYWRRLSPHGVLSISRYASGERAGEVIRITRLAQHTLERIGVEEPWRHMALAVSGGVATLIVTRDRIDEGRFARLDSLCVQRGFRREWPLLSEEPQGPIALRLAKSDKDWAAEGFDLTPPTDDRPFFFQTIPVFSGVHVASVEGLSANEHSVLLLRGLLVLMAVLAVCLFLPPFAMRRIVGDRMPWNGSLYFTAIGVGFMLVEVPWIQRFILYLGHPSYATTVVLAALLLAAGLGSLVSARVRPARVGILLALVPVIVTVVNFAAGPVFAETLGLPIAARIAISLALLAPAGFLMGFAFPSGLVAFGTEHTAWFWAVNGISSVVASVFALALTMTIGLTLTVFVGVAAYALAAALLFGLTRFSPGRHTAAAPARSR